MTTPPTSLRNELIAEIQQIPLNISSTRRSGNGLRNADEIADACLAVLAGRIDRVVECMEESKSPFQNHSSETHRRAMQQAIEIVQHAFPKPPTTKEQNHG